MAITKALAPTGRSAKFARTGPGAYANCAPLDARHLSEERLAAQFAGNGASTSAPAGDGDPQFISRYRWPEDPVMYGTTRVAAMAGGHNVVGSVVPRIIIQVVGGDDTHAVAASPLQVRAAPVAGMDAGADLVPQNELVNVDPEPAAVAGGSMERGERMVWRDTGLKVLHTEDYSHVNY